MFVYYNIYKRYKGIFTKKHVGNIHILLVPKNKQDFIYLLIIGEVIGLKNTYLTEKILTGKQSVIPQLMEIEKRTMDNNIIQIEKVPCTIKLEEKGFQIKLTTPGKYIPSIFKIEEPGEEYASISNIDAALILKGNLKLVEENITPNQYMMVRAKKVAFFKRIKDTLIKKLRGK